VGEVVVIDFFDGNIDRPFVVGRIHEAHRHPSKFDEKGKLPDTKKLSGIKSREYQGSGYNQLRFDDSTEQISSQLQSSHGASQLNLGNLSHPKETDTSEGRGEGFELRTDQWGAVRAGQGLLLSTYAQDSASGNHLDVTAGKNQLESSLNNSKALNEVAKNQQADPLENLDHLKSFIFALEKDDSDEAKNQADAFKQALMILASPNSIALTSNEDIHLSADGQISHTADDSINLSTQKSFLAHVQNKISLFAAQEGARLFAGKGKVEIQAQGDGADVIARKDIQIISTEDTVYIISPKEIRLVGDTSEVRINGSGVFATTPGLFEVKSGQQKFGGGQRIKAEIPLLPIMNEMKSFTNKWDFYNLFYENNFSEVKYKLINTKNSTYISGNLDEHGRTQRINTTENENYDILIGANEEWTISIDDGSEDDDFEYDCSCGSHEGEI
ncbi:MAG: DUF2345 domain-containing protein, partial [Acinetobacter sp.]|nr:DUF2345 domain-containing protein [Acinetobacter sp.]